MGKYIVEGNNRLSGEVDIHGAKNAVLPILAAVLLCDDSVRIGNCPHLSDVEAARNILAHLGRSSHWEGSSLIVDGGAPQMCDIPEKLMREMRSSIVFLGAVISRCSTARISFPGGCELGPRPIDLHLEALEKMGVKVVEDNGFLECSCEKKLKGAVINLAFPSVGATENIMLAACRADGETVIHNGAREPEIEDLAGFLNACGADISIEPNGTIHIKGVEKLHGAEYDVIPDRIVTVTYMCCSAVTAGELLLKSVNVRHLQSVMPIFEQMGCIVKANEDTIYLQAPQRLKAVKCIQTMPYPGFPTDAQAPLMAAACVASGTSIFIENIFENRFKHASEFKRMGAEIEVQGRTAAVHGVSHLHGANVKCTDLRGGAAVLVCALAAHGTTVVSETEHILRGYEDIDRRLALLGASIKKA
ncbi:MAG: UDP-N-acetylglucosamine 1-carboxyvinyltransferase [Oscillospiraceae bacterium]|nr:UDP-N-acetylglucosamine 1-carboxyvinyltransferase [Oscillospiraceae bacterium]